MMEQEQKKPFSKEEVLAVLEQLMGEMGALDKLDMPEESMSEMPEMEKKEDMEMMSEDSEESEKPALVVAIGSEEKPMEEDDMEPYLKHKMKGQMYK